MQYKTKAKRHTLCTGNRNSSQAVPSRCDPILMSLPNVNKSIVCVFTSYTISYVVRWQIGPEIIMEYRAHWGMHTHMHTNRHAQRYDCYKQAKLEVGPLFLIQIFDKVRLAAALHAIR